MENKPNITINPLTKQNLEVKSSNENIRGVLNMDNIKDSRLSQFSIQNLDSPLSVNSIFCSEQVMNLKSGKSPDTLVPVNMPLNIYLTYCDSFVFLNNNALNTRRFDRFVNKFKQSLFDMIKTLEPNFKGHYPNIKDFNSFVVEFMKLAYLPNENTYNEYNTVLKRLFLPKFAVENMSKNAYDSEVIKCMIEKPSQVSELFDLSLNDVINKEVNESMLHFLAFNFALSQNDDWETYTSFAMDSMCNCISFSGEVLSKVFVDLERMCSSKINDAIVETMQSDLVKELNTEYEKMEKEFLVKTDECERLNLIIQKLNDSLSKKDDLVEKKTEDLRNSLLEASRKNQKLEKRYDDLNKKYNRLKENSELLIQTNEEKKKEEENIVEVDMNGRYLFIIGDGATFKGIIKESFPNASFMNDNGFINEGSYDLVVIITSHIDHSTYFATRNQCRSKNIPCIHCDYSNVDRIKQTMFNFLNK